MPEVSGQLDVLEKTQLPILAMSVMELYKATGDKAFLAEIFPALAKYDDWMWRRRNTGDGLLVFYHGDESGWDNATRLLPLPVKTVDGSVAAYLQREALADIAGILGNQGDARKFRDRAGITGHSIATKMWDERSGFYYDLSTEDIRRPQKSLAGFMPPLAGIGGTDRVDALTKHLKNPGEFWTSFPVPTLSKDDPDYDSQTWGWNGPAWVPTNWFVMEAFARAGHVELANEILAKTVEMMSKPTGYPTATEQYNSETGIPFGVPDYSWCAVVNHYIIKWVAGLQPDAASDSLRVAPHLLPGWKFLRLSNLPVGDHIVSVNYDYSNGPKVSLTHRGPRALLAQVELPVTGRVVKVRVGGTDMMPDSYQVVGGVVRITARLLNDRRTIEVESEPAR